MGILTQGRQRLCKTNTGGINKLYIAAYKQYARSEIVTNGVKLLSIPDTLFHEFNYVGNPAINETPAADKGGKYYEQNISFSLDWQYETREVEKLINKDVRMLTKDRNGIYRIYGLYAGAWIDSIDKNTGGSKSDLNGYTINIKAKEIESAYFIDDIDDIGIIFGRLLLETSDFLMLETNDKIIL